LLVGLGNAFAFALVPWIFEIILRPTRLPNFSLSVALHLADDTVYFTGAARFWMTLGLAHGLSWIMLLAAGRIVESGWREETPLSAAPAASVAQSPGTGDEVNNPPTGIQEYWPARMEDDPANWLARRQLRHGHVLWLSLVTMGIGPHLSMLLAMFRPAAPPVGLYTAVSIASELLPLALLLFITSRCFAEARRGGEMEILLSTPLSTREIVLGQWRAIWQRFRTALIVTASLAGFITLVSLIEADWILGQYALIQAAQSAERLLCGLAACWLGLYLGIRMEAVSRAVGYGLLWLVAGPWLSASVFWLLIRPLIVGPFTGGVPTLFWVAQLVQVAVGCVYLAVIIWWSRRQLIQRLRELAARN
jgi:hypothetical protein